MDNYQEYIHISRYSRFLPLRGRREFWAETVGRYMETWRFLLTDKEYYAIQEDIHCLNVMPSMRMMWSAGPSLERNSAVGYNCAFIAVDNLKAFDETLYLLCCGVGVGFSVQYKHITNLPTINDKIIKTDHTITVEDSKEGWARVVRKCIFDAHLGYYHTYNFSKIRPEGDILKTSGGRASGPEPLKKLLKNIELIIQKAKGRKLNSLECHDIVCEIASVVIVGGVRRSALISLSDVGDTLLQNAKSGNWFESNPNRSLANNSAVYYQKPDILTFLDEWKNLIASKSGERGIFNLGGVKQTANARGRNSELLQGTNPCGEIVLRSAQFCNLTEVVLRPNDDMVSIRRKVEHATILGTLQSTKTHFPYIRKIWQTNTEEERLLGVSLTGIQDCPFIRKNPEALQQLQALATAVNKTWAKKLGINCSTAITTVKPSGTVSQLVGSSSGIHGRFSPYYIRRVQQSVLDPLTKFIEDTQAIKTEPYMLNPDKTKVFEFYMKAPAKSVMANSQSALHQLESWKIFYRNWAQHAVSATIYVKEHEWLDVANWVYKNFDDIAGLSFLPYTDHLYQQAPYEQITRSEYLRGMKQQKTIDWTKLQEYENNDNTTGAKQLACSGDNCEI